MTNEPVGGLSEALGEHADNPPRPRTSGHQVGTLWCPDCVLPLPRAVPAESAAQEGADKEEAGPQDVVALEACPVCGAALERRDWTISSFEMRLKAQFEQYVRRRAQRAYEDEGGGLTTSADRLRSVYLSDFACGHYNWGGKYVNAALTCPDGFYQALYLLMRRCDPQLTEGLCRQVVDCDPRGFAQALAWALGNSQAPAPQGRPGARTAMTRAQAEVHKPVTREELMKTLREPAPAR